MQSVFLCYHIFTGKYVNINFVTEIAIFPLLPHLVIVLSFPYTYVHYKLGLVICYSSPI